MLTLLETALSYAGEWIYDLYADVLLSDITIEVCENVEDVTRVLAETIEKLEDAIFIVILRISGVKNPQKEVLNEHTDRLFQMFPEVQKQAIEDWYGSREYLVFTGNRKFQQGTTQLFPDNFNEFLPLYKAVSWIFKTWMYQIKTQKNLSDIRNIL